MTSPAAELRTPRRAWIFEQLTRTVVSAERERVRHGTELSGASHQSTFSAKALAQADLGLLEISVLATQRFFTDGTPRSAALAAALEPEAQSIGVELSRYAISDAQKYGRIGLGYHLFFPDTSKRWLSIQMHTGLARVPSRTWLGRLHWGIFVPLHNAPPLIQLDGHVFRKIARSQSLGLDVGARFGVSMFVDKSRATGDYENVALSLGPVAELVSGLGTVQLETVWRAFLDKRVSSSGTLLIGEVPAAPDLSLKWIVYF